jgi:hypothetical protein
MPARFHDGGLNFLYPENWRLEREASEGGWTVTLQSPGTAFIVISLRGDSPDAAEVADTVLAALREEYKELEAEECTGSFAGKPAVGHDIQFFSLDLTGTCWTRVFDTPQGTILVMCQCSDLEPEKNEEVLRAICKSMTVDRE